MSAYTKYTKELLEPIVAESVSVADVLRKLGKRQSGSIATHLSKVIKKFEIDTSHFLGQAANCGSKHKGGPKKKTWKQILVKRKGDTRQKAFKLRRALVECGRTYSCEECHIEQWNGKEIKLQVDHKNGDWTDDRPDNLRFLCPNCHSQTANHSGSQGLTDLFTDARRYKERRKQKRTYRG